MGKGVADEFPPLWVGYYSTGQHYQSLRPLQDTLDQVIQVIGFVF